ncbi:RNA polymerase sigma factor [Paenibacillus sp. strain BS8-2]
MSSDKGNKTKSAPKGHYIVKHKGFALELYTEYTVPQSLEKLLSLILKEFSRRSPDKLQQYIDFINAEHKWLVNKDWDALDLAESIKLETGPEFWKALMESPWSQGESDEEKQYKLLKERVVKVFENYHLHKYVSDSGGSLTEEQQKQVDDIEAAVARLPEPERRLIEVRYYPVGFEYYTDYDAAQTLQISEGTFQKRRNSAFTKLAAAFGLNGPENQNEKDDET